MRLLSRYILREFIQPLAYCLVTFSSLFILLQLFDSFSAIMDNKPSVGAVLFYFIATLAPFLEWIFTPSLMLATLYTIWRFCRNSEISAMRASGISFISISAPILATAFLFTVLAFLNTEYFVPRYSESAQRMGEMRRKPVLSAAPVASDSTRISYFNATHRRLWQINRFDPLNPEILHGVLIKFERPDNSTERTVEADSARHLDGVWWLENPVEKHFDEMSFSIATPVPLLKNLTLRAFPQLNETPEDFRDETRRWEILSFQDRYRYIRNHPRLDDRGSKFYDMLYCLAAPWACMVMTLFAIPAGIATGRQSVARGVLMAILMFFAFYAFTSLCRLLAKDELLSPWIAAWAPNLIFLTAGLVLFYRQR